MYSHEISSIDFVIHCSCGEMGWQELILATCGMGCSKVYSMREVIVIYKDCRMQLWLPIAICSVWVDNHSFQYCWLFWQLTISIFEVLSFYWVNSIVVVENAFRNSFFFLILASKCHVAHILLLICDGSSLNFLVGRIPSFILFL